MSVETRGMHMPPRDQAEITRTHTDRLKIERAITQMIEETPENRKTLRQVLDYIEIFAGIPQNTTLNGGPLQSLDATTPTEILTKIKTTLNELPTTGALTLFNQAMRGHKGPDNVITANFS
jgi:hypothetical protein